MLSRERIISTIKDRKDEACANHQVQPYSEDESRAMECGLQRDAGVFVNGRSRDAALSRPELCSITTEALKAAATSSQHGGGDIKIALCQGVTKNGVLCTRAAQAISIDLRDRADKLNEWLPVGLSTRLFDFSRQCCFFCWQHGLGKLAYLGTFVLSPRANYTINNCELMDFFFDGLNIENVVESDGIPIPRCNWANARARPLNDVLQRVFKKVAATVAMPYITANIVTPIATASATIYIMSAISTAALLVFFLPEIGKALSISRKRLVDAARVAAEFLVSKQTLDFLASHGMIQSGGGEAVATAAAAASPTRKRPEPRACSLPPTLPSSPRSRARPGPLPLPRPRFASTPSPRGGASPTIRPRPLPSPRFASASKSRSASPSRRTRSVSPLLRPPPIPTSLRPLAERLRTTTTVSRPPPRFGSPSL